jgi:pilus assembly protein CpaE
MMPQMDGYEVCRTIKSDQRTSHLPVVMLTAKAQTASQLEGFRAGAIDYITKPVHPQDLVTRISSVLERARAAQEAVGANFVAVAGAKGGVGATTVAVNLAVAMAAHARTVLIDLEMSGSDAIHLGLEPKSNIGDLSQTDTGASDPAAVSAALAWHTSGLQLLAASDSALEPAQVGLILNHVAGLCEACVLDMGWGVGTLTRLAAQRVKSFVVIIDSDRATLSQANRLLHVLKESYFPPEAIKLIWVNRQGLPSDGGQRAIETMLGRPPDLIVEPAADVLYQALDNGQPLVSSQPDHPVAVQLRQLAESLVVHKG